MTLELEDFSVLPAFGRSTPPRYSEPYRLLAPLVALSFPSGIALPPLNSDAPVRSSRRNRPAVRPRGAAPRALSRMGWPAKPLSVRGTFLSPPEGAGPFR